VTIGVLASNTMSKSSAFSHILVTKLSSASATLGYIIKLTSERAKHYNGFLSRAVSHLQKSV
jgi:hypothetical protein